MQIIYKTTVLNKGSYKDFKMLTYSTGCFSCIERIKYIKYIKYNICDT